MRRVRGRAGRSRPHGSRAVSTECREIVAGLVTLGVAMTVWGVWPAFTTWRANRRLVREFRLSLRAFDSRHVDAWSSSGGREPPR